MQGKPALFDCGLFYFSGGKEGRGGKVQGARCEVRRASALPRGAASAVIGPWTAAAGYADLNMQMRVRVRVGCRSGAREILPG